MYGSLVGAARRSRGLTQDQLAALSGVDQPNISAIERGRRAPSTETLHRLLHACGYELTATAGAQRLALPPPDDDAFFAALLERSPYDEAPTVTPATSPTARARSIVAVLDLAEALVRSR